MTNEKKLRELTDEELKQVNGGFTLGDQKLKVTEQVIEEQKKLRILEKQNIEHLVK